MAEIIKTYCETIPALRFIGRRYTNADRQNGSFSHIWGQWFEAGWFEKLEKLNEAEGNENDYIGFMRYKQGEPNSFEYWIGLFAAPGTQAPEGFDFIDLAKGSLGVCWIKGKDDAALYSMHDECVKSFRENGLCALGGCGEWTCFFERYNCPRFTEPDENGDVILDYCAYLCEGAEE
ncbi:MAG: hypothetical protein ACOX8S_02440 [Christensenellales bacterium]